MIPLGRLIAKKRTYVRPWRGTPCPLIAHSDNLYSERQNCNFYSINLKCLDNINIQIPKSVLHPHFNFCASNAKNAFNKSTIVSQLTIKSAYLFIQFEKAVIKSRSCRTKKKIVTSSRESWDGALRGPVVKKRHPWDWRGQHRWLLKATTRCAATRLAFSGG